MGSFLLADGSRFIPGFNVCVEFIISVPRQKFVISRCLSAKLRGFCIFILGRDWKTNATYALKCRSAIEYLTYIPFLYISVTFCTNINE
jgi:hypothetical protein